MLAAANMDPAANMLPEKLDFERSPTAILLSAQESISALVTNSRAWKANAHSRRCMGAGLNFGWLLSRVRSDGAVDPE
jgi:hypothetical protein